MDQNNAMLEAAREQVRREGAAVQAVAEQLDETFPAAVRTLYDCRGKVFVSGSGTSSTIARRMAHLLSVCGTPAVFLSAMDALHGTMGAVTDGDVVILISHGGESDELIQLGRRVKDRGAQVIALTGTPTSNLAGLADIAAIVRATVDQADPGNIIAMGSTLAVGAWGDAIAYVLMRQRGYSWDELLHTHPAGAVGLIDAAPAELQPLDVDQPPAAPEQVS